MGQACIKTRTVEWQPPETAAWGHPQSSPVKPYLPELSTGPTENLIRAHHARSPARQSSGGVQEQIVEEEEELEEKITWSCGDCIGQGAFGKVFLGLNTVSGKLMAVKQIKISSEQAMAVPVAEHVQKVEAEVHVLKQLHHPNIVRYLGTERTDESLNIFLEYVPGGSIASLLGKFGKFNEAIIKIYTRQILLGLEYLHNHGIMHRDIKGGNLLLDNSGHIKLADFGASKKIESLATIDSQMKQSITGTPHWMAPEVVHQHGVGRAADIWSVACTIIEMATGKPPWSHITSQVSVMLHIAQTDGPPALPDHLSSACRDFLRLCFNRSARDRPNASRLLQHPFLEGLIPAATSTSPASKAALVPAWNRVDVPSPIQEETRSGNTPSSRGTGTTTSSSASSRRPGFAGDELGNRYSPMGAGVRQSHAIQLLPVAEGSHEDQADPIAETQPVEHSKPDIAVAINQIRSPLSTIEVKPPGSRSLRSSYEDFNPMSEPTWGQENAPWEVNIGSPRSNIVLNVSATTAGLQISSPKALSLQINQEAKPILLEEATEQSIKMWVQDRARTETLRLSQSFSNYQAPPHLVLSPKRPIMEVSEQKQAQWEAELQKELEQQRQEQRRSRAMSQHLPYRSPAR